MCGWANSYRDHGGIVFIDLRDKSGLIQLVCDPADNAHAHKLASEVRDEFVLIAHGRIRTRGEGLVNPRLQLVPLRSLSRNSLSKTALNLSLL